MCIVFIITYHCALKIVNGNICLAIAVHLFTIQAQWDIVYLASP